MAALNFYPQFEPLIKCGQKNTTIRRLRKNPIKPGEKLFLYTQQRTKNCRKIGVSVALSVEEIVIRQRSVTFIPPNKPFTLVNSNQDFLQEFAYRDGFHCWEALAYFFKDVHGLPFHGQRITWGLLTED